MRWWPTSAGGERGSSWAPPTALDTPAALGELERFRLWHLQRVRKLRGGEYLGRTRGESNEFREHRPYVPGDDFRFIDWGLFIRLDRVYVKTFQDQEYQTIHILLDDSRSMASGAREKFAVARDLALALAHLSLVNQDQIALGLLAHCGGRKKEASIARHPLKGARAVQTLRTVLSRLRPEGIFRPAASLTAHAARYARRAGLAVLISDFLVDPGDLAAGLGALARARFATAAIQVRHPEDDSFPAEGSLVRAIDQETGQTRLVTVDAENRRRHEESVRRHTAAVDAACRRLNVPITRYRTTENALDFLRESLPRTGLLRARGCA